MKVLDQIRLIVYRVHEKGLEILTLQDEENPSPLLVCKLDQQLKQKMEAEGKLIYLDEIDSDQGPAPTVAIEGDWHDIPSIRGLIKRDIQRLERKVLEVVPELEHYTYVAVKDAFKKAMPEEYAALKELKDILSTRSMIRNI